MDFKYCNCWERYGEQTNTFIRTEKGTIDMTKRAVTLPVLEWNDGGPWGAYFSGLVFENYIYSCDKLLQRFSEKFALSSTIQPLHRMA